MIKYQPETDYLQEIGLAVLEQGVNGIHCFISEDKKDMVVVVDLPLGAKRFKEHGNNLAEMEILLAEKIRKSILDVETITMDF